MGDRPGDQDAKRQAHQRGRGVTTEAQPDDRGRLQVDGAAQQRGEFEQRAAIALADQGASPGASANPARIARSCSVRRRGRFASKSMVTQVVAARAATRWPSTAVSITS